MIVVINVIAAKVFELIASFEKAPTKNEETSSIFMKLTVLQFFNIAIVLLLVNFNLDWGLINYLKQFGILTGRCLMGKSTCCEPPVLALLS